MHDFKYRDLFGPKGGPYVTVPPDESFRAQSLESVLSAFFANIARATIFAHLPAKIAFSVRRAQLFSDCAELNVLGKLDPNYLRFLNNESPEGYVEEFDRLMKEHGNPSQDRSHLAQAKSQIGLGYIESVLLAQHQGMQKGIEALLSFLVLESWTAFEVLSADLWVLAVDNGPKEVAAKVALSKQLQKADDQITPETVHTLEYDPRKDLGSFLRETGRVSFQKLDHIRLYYSEAFGKQAKNIFDETCGGYIYALAAFRNALIHNAGKADKHFVKRVQRFPEFKTIQQGASLPLDGEIVKKLSQAGVDVAIGLIKLVDDVLMPPSKKS
jgi:hypothetical protein